MRGAERKESGLTSGFLVLMARERSKDGEHV